jgi:hypothetical protein
MRPELAARAATQSGLITRRQAVANGYTERELRTMTAVYGPWVVVRRGVYAEREYWESLTGYDEQAALRDRAAHLVMRARHVMSHDSAGRAYRLPMLRPKHELVHVTRPGVGGSRTEHGVKHHLSRLSPGQVTTVGGLPVAGLARTALDIGREHGFEAGTVACDGAMRVGVTRQELAAELESMSCWPNITRARAAADHADPGAETVGETLARLLVAELGHGRPRTQFPVRIATGVVWCDLLVGRHVFEFDGRIKYLRQQDGGVASRPVEEILWEEKKRERLVRAEGLGMSRIIFDDFWGSARVGALQRLQAEYQLTAAQLGTVLPDHLEVFAREMAGRRSA